MELDQVMRTAFAAREFTDDPLPDDVLYRILDRARFAPSGGNRQGWRVIVVRDGSVRRQLAELVKPTMQLYVAQVQAGENPFNTVHESKVDPASVGDVVVPAQLLDYFETVSVLLLVAVDLSVVASLDRDLPRVGVISGASIYPFVWNILLAARGEGYGGALTTFLAGREPEAQKLLDLPEHFAIAALLPIGKPTKQLTRLRRNPVEDFTVLERWGGEPFRGT